MPRPKVCFNSKKTGNALLSLPADSRAYKMAETARLNRISKERSEMQTHALKTYFDKMTDPQQILQDQSMDVGHPPVPEPAAPVQVVPD